MINSDFGNNKDLNKTKLDYENDKNQNQVEIDYKNYKKDIEIKTNYKDNKNYVKIETNYSDDKENIFLEVIACYNLLLSYSCLANVQNSSNEIIRIAKFDIMQSNSSIDPIAVGFSLLTSTVNWKCGSIWDIYVRMSEVSYICQAIYV